MSEKPSLARRSAAGHLAAEEPPMGSNAAKMRLAVVMINWNGWRDTIECLESLLRAEGAFRVIIIDNGSEDGSIARIEAWASGEEPFMPVAGPLRRFTYPALDKPVSLRVIGAEEARTQAPGPERITLVDAQENLGFSAGSNLGMRHALNDPAVTYCWCLNNDTIVDPSAPKAILARMDATHKVGMCGTQVRFYQRPGTWQTLNGSRFNLLTGQSKGIGLNQPVTRPFDPRKVARETDFVLGASLAVSRAFLETVGFMEESYFLYFEEMDWSVRNRGRFVTAFAHPAIVYHKEGGSIGSSGKKGQRSEVGEYYLLRSRIKFYRRNFPLLWPLQYPLAAALILRRLGRGQPKKAAAMTRAMLGMPRV